MEQEKIDKIMKVNGMRKHFQKTLELQKMYEAVGVKATPALRKKKKADAEYSIIVMQQEWLGGMVTEMEKNKMEIFNYSGVTVSLNELRCLMFKEAASWKRK